MASYGILFLTRMCSGKVMKICFLLAILLVMYSNGCCRETEHDGNSKLDDSATNLTTEDDSGSSLFANLMRPQKFTPGTLLGLLVAAMVVVVGSFLVLWKVCCEVEVRVSREAMEPLTSISQGVSGRSVSGECLLGHGCSVGALEIA